MKRPPEVTEEQLDDIARDLAQRLTAILATLDAADRRRWADTERQWRASLQGGRQ